MYRLLAPKVLLFGATLVCLLVAVFAPSSRRLLPVVLYHGMGDTCCSPGMQWVAAEIKRALPGTYVHSIRIGSTTKSDRTSSLFDNLNRQIDKVCAQLKADPHLAGGFNAVGFSQGGQLLRAYVERCNDPPVHNLVTFGAQHQGIMDLPGCQPQQPPTPLTMDHDPLERIDMLEDVGISSENENITDDEYEPSDDCSWWKRLLRLGVYSALVRDRIVQAQYFKDPRQIELYMKYNKFLLDINNDGPEKNYKYRQRLSSLNTFVMYMFTKDVTLVPPQSSWFGYFNGSKLLDLKEQQIYQEDWIGLRELDERHALHFRTIDGGHMGLPKDFVQSELVQWLDDRK